MRPSVLLSRRIPSVALSRLEEVCDVELFRGERDPNEAELIAALRDKDGLVTPLTTTISRAVAGASRDAGAVASATGMQNPSAMLAALVDARQQLLYTQAGAKMMNTASEMLGTIIDISA